MNTIDLNCDMGEGLGNETEIMPFISSCNIACGLHAGGRETMKEVIELALNHDVSIGAHPSFDDREHFGRKEMQLTTSELIELVHGQLADILGVCEATGATLRYVKPHGALYNLAAKDRSVSHAIIDSILSIDNTLALMGLAKSESQKAAENRIHFIAEGFADRAYADQSKLVARNDGGLITDMEVIESQLRHLLLEEQIPTPEGPVPLSVQSICLHGDTPGAEKMISEIHQLVKKFGFEIQHPA